MDLKTMLLATVTAVALNGMAAPVMAQEEIQELAVENAGMVPRPAEASRLFLNAFQSYTDAKMSPSLGTQSDAYADAIRDISQACTMEPRNVEYLILASQIYRSKGGSSYAKDYFFRAEEILRQRVEEHPEDVHASLDYAIACLAGEGRRTESYRKKGEKCRDRVIELCEPELKSKHPDAGRLRALGMAYLLKGQPGKCEKVLSKAAQLGATSAFYYALYKETAKEGKWIWPVGKEGAAREFCLYCLMDSDRNYGA